MTQTNTSEKGALRSDQSSLMFGEGFSFSGYERDPLYLNRGDGTFLDVSGCSGIDSISDGRAGVFADLDNDGDLDVLMTTIQGPAHLLFRNNVGQDSGFLRIVLEGGNGASRDAFGSVVRVHTSAGILTKIKAGGSGYISENDPRLLFGLGADPSVGTVEVTWPGGTREIFAGPFAAGRTLRLRQGTGHAETIAVRSARLPDPLTRTETFARDLRFAIGGPLPEVPVRTLDGEVSTLRGELGTGRRTLLNLWATWCGPCRLEMPGLEALRPRLAEQGIDVVGLNVDADPDADVAGYVAARGVGYPVLVAGPEALEHIYATDAVTVPLSFLIDEKGVVVELLPGWSVESRRRLEALAGSSPAGR